MPATGARSVALGPDGLGAGASVASLADLTGHEDLVLVPVAGTGDDVPTATHELTARVLDLVQSWPGDGRFADSRLVFVTCGAVAADEGETVRDLAAGAVWGLVRSAQSENPGRFVLLDTEKGDLPATLPLLPGLLAAATRSSWCATEPCGWHGWARWAAARGFCRLPGCRGGWTPAPRGAWTSCCSHRARRCWSRSGRGRSGSKSRPPV
ncbi:hypothetical protein ACFQ2B_00705 [Streptomyces stramineus]